MMKFTPLQASTESTLRVITNHVNSVTIKNMILSYLLMDQFCIVISPANILSDSTMPDESLNCKISLNLTTAFCSGMMPDCI